MSAAGAIGILFSLAALPFAAIRSKKSVILFLCLLLEHLLSTIVYYLYVHTTKSDAAFYYYDPYNFSRFGFSLGTQFTLQLIQLLKTQFHATYLDCFLIFQSLGLWGIILLAVTFQDMNIRTQVVPTKIQAWILFLPSMHFWTSAIGKDAPVFFAVALCTWASMRFSSRVGMFVIGIAVLLLFRPYMALVTVAALAAAAATDPSATTGRRFALLVIASIGVILTVPAVTNTIQLDVTSASSISSFFQARSDVAASYGGTTAVGNVSVLVGLLYLIFRPFFFDAPTPLGIVASFENVLFVMLIFYLLLNVKVIVYSMKKIFFIRYSLMVSAMTFFVIAATYYNVGLGLRQRVMAFPPLFCLFIAVWLIKRRRVQQAGPAARVRFRNEIQRIPS